MEDKKYNRKHILIILSLLLLFASGCSVVASIVLLGRIRGVVTDATTGKPIYDVYVRAYSCDDSDFDYTGQDGSYVLNLESGFYDVYFRKEGYYDEKCTDIGVVAPFTRSLDVKMTPISPSPTPIPTPDYSLFATRGGENKFDAFHIDKDTGVLTRDPSSPISTGQTPYGILAVGSKYRIYVLNTSANTVSVYSSVPSYPTIVRAFSLSTTDGSPYHMVYNPSTESIFVSFKDSSSPGKVEILDVSDPNKIYSRGTINAPALPQDPRDLVLHNSKQYLFIASYNGNAISSYDITNKTLKDTYNIDKPISMAIFESENKLYVVGENTRKITLFDISDPTNITNQGETVITNDANQKIIDCALATDRDLLFTLDGGSSGYFIRVWNINGNPPFTNIQTISLGTKSTGNIIYIRSLGFLIALHDVSNGGISVFDCRSFPDRSIYEISGSPFYTDNSYLQGSNNY